MYNIMMSGSVKPKIILKLNNQEMEFLCDSGACRTTVKQPIPHAVKGKQLISVRTASGSVEMVPLTEPIQIEDPHADGHRCQAPVLQLPKCPVNLLGRDLMVKLRIGLMPNFETGQMEVVRYSGDALQVVEGQGLPSVYYSLDIPSAPPLLLKSELLKLASNLNTDEDNTDRVAHLHVTMWYRGPKGTDPEYEKALQRCLPAKITIGYIYSDQLSATAASVTLPARLNSLFMGNTVPHMSITKCASQTWKTLGGMVLLGETATDWAPDAKDPSVERSRATGLVRRRLFWTANATFGVHMTSRQ